MNTMNPAGLPPHPPARASAWSRANLEFPALCLTGLLSAATVWALDHADIPVDAPQDGIMASPADVQQMLDWASAVFAGGQPTGSQSRVRVDLLRQDFNVLRFGQSCLETPIKIGTQEYPHGLGTHANSEIVLHLPPGARAFRAHAGIDNNFDTQGQRGSAQFSVEVGGKEIFRTRR